ncbi:MAG: hypothetical protein ACRDXX_12525, partial [Stackebrandtia sp.]
GSGSGGGFMGRGGGGMMGGGMMGGAGRGMGDGGGGAASANSWLHEDRDPFTADDAAPPIVGGMPRVVPDSEDANATADAA